MLFVKLFLKNKNVPFLLGVYFLIFKLDKVKYFLFILLGKKVLFFDSEDKRPLILPTPNPLPNIVIPFKFYEKFRNVYPYIHFIIENEGKEDKKFTFNSQNVIYEK